MEITYQRHLHKSYMCIEEQECTVEEHELMMLQRYKVPQLLPMQTMVQDGKIQYWFEITGKQQLKDYLGGKPVEIKHIKKFLFSLEQLCRKMPEFLLKEERVCLQEELLYVDLADETVYFTYLPFRQGDFPEEFRNWMEETLKKINHQNRRCAELAYDLYEKVRRENISIRELLYAEEWNTPEWQTEESDILERNKQQEIQNFKEAVKYDLPITEKEAEPEQRNIFKNKIKELWQEQKETVENKLFRRLEKNKASISKIKFPGKDSIVQKRKEKEEQFFQKTELSGKERQVIGERQNITGKNPTEALELYPGRPEGKLIYQGRNACEDFWIEKEEFLIGRSIQQADGKIETDGISRIHAKITRKEGEYYIEDLNSTNGTYLNGELLEYHRDRKLKRNDRIRFGIEEYVFC